MRMSEATQRRVIDTVASYGRPITMGKVVKIVGLTVEVSIPQVKLGDIVDIATGGTEGEHYVACEILGFRDQNALAIPLGELRGVAPGALVRARHRCSDIPVGVSLLGRVVDAFGKPIDGGPAIHCTDRVAVDAKAPPVSERANVLQQFSTSVRVIDGMLTCGRGQRVGIFAGAGVGKSVLTEQIASQSFADVTVVGLIGERGREVRELMSSSRKSQTVIVAATSDRSPMERARGAKTATAVAEYFRDRGANVLLVIDSLTRYAMAMREIGLSLGEPPATKGYPPSVFAALPRLLERVSPMSSGGAITAFYTVLVEGDDLSDPVADSARSLLDAHIVLSRELAGRGQFPAVDVLASASRVVRQIVDAEGLELMRKARMVLADRQMVQELRSLGAYVPGANKEYDNALRVGKNIDEWARQSPDERSSYEETMRRLREALNS